MPLNNRSVLQPARWSVMWRSNGRWIEKEVDDDFAEAQRLLCLLARAGREPFIRSVNVGFPPPARIVAHKKYKMVGKRKIAVIVNKMEGYNRDGIFWCPYCVKLRRFRKEVRGISQVFVCPTCGVSTRDGNVVRYNPFVLSLEVRRRVRGRRTRRRSI